MHSWLLPRVFSSLLLLARCPYAGCAAAASRPGHREGIRIGPLKRSGGHIHRRDAAEMTPIHTGGKPRSETEVDQIDRPLRSASGALRAHCGRNLPESTGLRARRGPIPVPVDAVARLAPPLDSGRPIRGVSGLESGPGNAPDSPARCRRSRGIRCRSGGISGYGRGSWPRVCGCPCVVVRVWLPSAGARESGLQAPRLGTRSRCPVGAPAPIREVGRVHR